MSCMETFIVNVNECNCINNGSVPIVTYFEHIEAAMVL